MGYNYLIYKLFPFKQVKEIFQRIGNNTPCQFTIIPINHPRYFFVF